MRNSIALAVGTSFPTGNDGATEDGVRIDQHAQIGTGSFGPYAGLQYRLARDPFNLFASVSGRMHSSNDYGYRFGDSLQFSLLLQYRPIDRLVLRAGLDGRWAARDSSQGDLQANTGGLVLAASPGIQYNLWNGLWGVAQVQVPFYSHLYGEQSVGPAFSAGVQYRFF